MNLLLDTHIFIWYAGVSASLSKTHRDAILNPANQIHVSVISIWEAVIKHQLSKLSVPGPPASWMPQARAQHKFSPLPLDELVFPTLASLPLIHRDPFDRMLIAQALHHNLTLVTVDPQIQAYPVPTL